MKTQNVQLVQVQKLLDEIDRQFRENRRRLEKWATEGLRPTRKMTVAEVREEVADITRKLGGRMAPVKRAQTAPAGIPARPIGAQESSPAMRPTAGRPPVSPGLSQLDLITIQAAAKGLAQRVPRPEGDLVEMLREEVAKLREGSYRDVGSAVIEAVQNVERDIRAGAR